MKWFKLLFLMLLTACTTTVRPKEVVEFNKTAVMVTNAEESSGGTGVIYKSGSHSYVLTNRHVCGLLKEGGFVTNGEERYPVKAFKVSRVHDICYVVVDSNLRVNTVLSSSPPELGSKAFISGHPSLYPHVLSQGYVSEAFKIEIVMDTRDCTREEFLKDPITCLFVGYPIVEELEAQLVSALIAPGSSGSAVFNEDGEIIGLAFASNSRSLAYALVVPWEYVANFVYGESRSLRWTYPAKAKASEKNRKVKERGTILPFTIKEDAGFYKIENWKKLIQFIQEEQCKK